MALWTRIRIHPETWPELEDAANERFWDGIALACDDHRGTGAIYLWGYVAEVLIKCASLRARGVSGTATVAPILHGEGIWHHRLSDLLHDLRTVRIAASRPLGPVLDSALGSRVNVLSQNWDVSLRYRSTRATETELTEVYNAVEWLMSSYAVLV